MQKRFLKYIFPISFMLMISFSMAMPVFAANYNFPIFPCDGAAANPDGTGTQTDINKNPVRECTFGDVIEAAQAIAAKIVQIGLIVSPLIFAYAGYLYLTSGGNVQKRKDANKIFKNVVIGIVVMMLAWVLVNLILTALIDPAILGQSWFPWSQ